MRFVCVAFLLAVVAISATSSLPVQTDGEDFQDLVRYLEYNLSPNDIHEMLEVLPAVLVEPYDEETDEEESEAMQRSIGSAIANASEYIPWNKIVSALQTMTKKDSKFSKVLNLVNDPKFRELVRKSVNSRTLREFVKGVAEHGFSWTEFLHLLLHALCSASSTIQHDQYSVAVCKVLQNL